MASFSFSTKLMIFVVVLTAGIVLAQDKHYTDEERTAIANFRPTVAKVLVRDFQKQDGYLLRWIRSYDFDLKKAAEALKKNHNWRKEQNIDKLLDEDNEADKKYLPYSLDGFDRAGRPVLLLPFGKWQLRKYVLAGKRDVVIKQYRRLLEESLQKIFKTAKENDQDIDQFYTVADMEGFSVRESLCLGCLPVILEMARTFDSGSSVYPKNMTIVNTPRLFQAPLALIKNILRSQAVQAIHDYDNNKYNWQRELFKDVTPENLPPYLGGTRKV